jgi:hypothetical protein
MKPRTLMIGAIACLFAMLFLPALARAVGSVSYGDGWQKVTRSVWCLTITWIGDSSDGSVPDKEIPDQKISGHVMHATTDPGSPAPTDGYSITLKDADASDVFGGSLSGRDTADIESAEPLIPFRYFSGALTFALTGNSVASATGTCKIYVLVK